MNRQNEATVSVTRRVRPLLVGAAVAAVTGIVLLLGLAALMAALALPQTASVPLALAVIALASGIGGFVTARLTRERGLWYGAGQGLLFFVVLAVVGIAASADVFGVGMLWRLALAVGLGALGGVLGVNLRRR